ncbi:MAG: (deoxy)nucleoside triphosphate pyrophosphohydrolase [Sphingobacteriales bacterium]|nr:MAG: (deoxy)nucleoside triphosphate pyrophosphohydrolase [Sphingobacteriales bacterium]
MANSKEVLVGAAIIVYESKILIAKRAPHKTLAGFWEFPGGKVEKDETVAECLKREILEELGINIEVGNFFMQNNHQYETITIELHTYLCKLISFDIQLIDHDEFAWVERTHLREYKFAPADEPFLDALAEGIGIV